jgi:hypothetical protein
MVFSVFRSFFFSKVLSPLLFFFPLFSPDSIFLLLMLGRRLQSSLTSGDSYLHCTEIMLLTMKRCFIEWIKDEEHVFELLWKTGRSDIQFFFLNLKLLTHKRYYWPAGKRPRRNATEMFMVRTEMHFRSSDWDVAIHNRSVRCCKREW